MSFPRHFGLGVAVGAAGAATLLLIKHRAEGQRQPAPTVAHKALRFGSPSVDSLRLFDGFVVEYDPRTRNPAWVLEHVSREGSYGEGDRKNVEFKEDASFEERFRAKLTDFRGSGYDRGHMAPAANHKASQTAMDQTFLLTNISPQVGKGFNRDYWARFERFVKELAKDSEEVFVATGPLFLPAATPQGFQMRHPLIGEPPRLVSVPTHFFKVVLASRGPGREAALAAFVMPNAAIPPGLPLTAFAVPLEALEAAAGLRFFPAALDAEKRAWHDRGALSWQAAGRAAAAAALGAGPELALPPLLLPPPPQTTAAQELPIGVLEKEPQQAAVDSSLRPGRQLLHCDVTTAEPIDRALAAGAAARRSAEPAPAPPQGPSAAEAAAAALLEEFGTPETRRAESQRLGLAHLCDQVPCQLPPPDWYLKRRGKQQEGGQQPAKPGSSS